MEIKIARKMNPVKKFAYYTMQVLLTPIAAYAGWFDRPVLMDKVDNWLTRNFLDEKI